MTSTTNPLVAYTQPILTILLTVIVACILLNTEGSLTPYWSNESLKALAIWTLVSLSIFLICKLIFKVLAPIICIAITLSFLFVGAGISQSITVILFTLSIYVLGRNLLGWLTPHLANTPLWIASLILGATFYIAILGFLVHFPINYQLTYSSILVAPLLLYFLSAQNRLLFIQYCIETISKANGQLSLIHYGIFCATLIVIGYIGTYVFIPSVMHDDHVFHLAMWSQLEYQHQYHFDVNIQKWSLAPFALDSLHGFTSVITRTDSRASLNVALLTLLVLSVWRLLSIIIENSNYRTIALCLFASTPMLSNLLLSLQTELILALLTTTGAIILYEKANEALVQSLSLFLICCLLAAVKLTAIFIAVAFFMCFLIGHSNNALKLFKIDAPTQLKILLVLSVGLIAGIHSYFFAYIKTGNPLYPLFNELFNDNSDLSGISGSAFIREPSFKAFIGFFFDSSNYFESKNFIAGFQYFLLPLLGFIYFLFSKKKLILLYTSLPIIIFGAVIFSQMQYWRYFFPVLPLASVLFGILFIGNPKNILVALVTPTIFTAYILLNLVYLPGVAFLFNGNHFKYFFPEEKITFQQGQIPEAALNTYISTTYPSSKVLMAIGRPYGATLGTTPIYAGKMAPTTFKAIKGITSEEAFLNYLSTNKIDFVYWNTSETQYRFSFQSLLKKVIDDHFIHEQTLGSISLYRRKDVEQTKQ